MGRTEQAERFRIDFIDAIKAKGASVEDMSSFALIFDEPRLKAIFQRWDSLGRELFYIDKVGFINVHVRSEPPGFWGIAKRVKDDFEIIKKAIKIPCWYVLLVGAADDEDVNGYILEDVFSSPLINQPSEQQDAFKINERDLDKLKVISSSSNIANILIKIGSSRFNNTKGTVIRRTKK